METTMENSNSLSNRNKKQKTKYYSVKVQERTMYNVYARLLDIISSLMGLIITLPVVILVGILIKLEDYGPIFYKQERLGKKGKRFWVYKLRSMRMDAEKDGIQWAEKDDPRITKVGMFIRKTRIDELPQLINILKGDMSLIGPRPERPELTTQFNKEIPGFSQRLAVKPGLTGWAQVNGGYDISPEEKLKLDIFYIENRKFSMDVKIIFKTIKVVVTGEGAR